jgi:ABC-type molybdate transport system ATPase subunit
MMEGFREQVKMLTDAQLITALREVRETIIEKENSLKESKEQFEILLETVLSRFNDILLLSEALQKIRQDADAALQVNSSPMENMLSNRIAICENDVDYNLQKKRGMSDCILRRRMLNANL